MRKIVRYGLRITGAAAALLLLAWIILRIYVGLNEEYLITRITGAVESETGAKMHIDRLSVGLLRSAPFLSLQLTGLSVRDSLYAVHQKELLQAEKLHLQISIVDWIRKRRPVHRVTIVNGHLQVFTDSLGRSNEYLLHRRQGQPEDRELSLPAITARNLRVTYSNHFKNKLYQATLRDTRCRFIESDKQLRIRVRTTMLLQGLGFNLKKGSFARNHTADGTFELGFDRPEKKLLIDGVRLHIDRHPFIFNGWFDLKKESRDFRLLIATRSVRFESAVSLMNDSIRSKLERYAFTRPVDIAVDLSGKTIYRFIPLVEASLTVENNTLTTPYGVFESCSFKGGFGNEMLPGLPRRDNNSFIRIDSFSGTWEKIPLKSRSMRFSNIADPFLECDLHAAVDMRSLNRLTGSQTLNFEGGRASAQVVFRGPVTSVDSATANLDGKLRLEQVKLKYLPRNFLLSDCNGLLRFSGGDLIVDSLSANTGTSVLEMRGQVANFLSLLHASPEKLVMNWSIGAAVLNLGDFMGFLTPYPGRKTGRNPNARFGQVAANVDRMFTDAEVRIGLQARQVRYRQFTASNAQANVILTPGTVKLEKASFGHAGGKVDLQAALKNGSLYNPVTLQVHMRELELSPLFKAFGNFGQSTLTHQHLKGRLNADIRYQASITNKARLVNSESQGTVHFLLKDAELNHFEPLLDISEKVLRKQDFSRVRFADLENMLEIKGTSFIINPMEIRSTALNLTVEGVYDLEKGSDMSISFPVNNLLKSQADTDLGREGRGYAQKGMKLRLRLKTQDDGTLKLSWDPFRRGTKRKKALQDSSGLKD